MSKTALLYCKWCFKSPQHSTIPNNMKITRKLVRKLFLKSKIPSSSNSYKGGSDKQIASFTGILTLITMSFPLQVFFFICKWIKRSWSEKAHTRRGLTQKWSSISTTDQMSLKQTLPWQLRDVALARTRRKWTELTAKPWQYILKNLSPKISSPQRASSYHVQQMHLRINSLLCSLQHYLQTPIYRNNNLSIQTVEG